MSQDLLLLLLLNSALSRNIFSGRYLSGRYSQVVSLWMVFSFFIFLFWGLESSRAGEELIQFLIDDDSCIAVMNISVMLQECARLGFFCSILYIGLGSWSFFPLHFHTEGTVSESAQLSQLGHTHNQRSGILQLCTSGPKVCSVHSAVVHVEDISCFYTHQNQPSYFQPSVRAGRDFCLSQRCPIFFATYTSPIV